MKLSEAAARVIELARITQSEVAAAESGTIDITTIVTQLRRPPSEASVELRAFFFSLPVATIYSLMLVMYVGRGDFSARDFLVRYEQLKGTFDKPQFAVDQMMSKTPLPDFMQRGLERLSLEGVDVDSLLE